MHSLSAARGRHTGSPFSRRVIGAIAQLSMCGCLAALAQAQEATSKANPPARAEFREPVTLASRDGVLEVRLTARQGTARLDTVATPVKNFFVFDYQLIRGAPSDGQMSGGNLYPAPTLQVFPGETLIVHLENGLSGLTIRDYFSPQYTRKGETVPIYPEQLTSSPLNLHVHGVHVSPKGNADNVLLHIPAGMSNTYTYNIPNNMPQGAYWYHSHLHGLTAAQTYLGLAGLLSIGRTDGNLPLVTQNSIPIRNMLLQYNFVSNRENDLAQLNNPYWPQFVSTIKAPQGDELAKGTYRPLLTPVNFTQSKPGQKYFTTWWGGPLSIQNQRGRLQFIPSNLLRFTPQAGSADPVIPPDPSLPDSQRDVQFTVNGQFQPVIHSKAGQTEIWVLANISDIAYINVQLTETATGRHPKIAIVGQDGNPYPAVHFPPTDDGTRLLVPPASRFAIAVTIPAQGDLVLEIPPRGSGTKTISTPGVLYTSNGTENPPAVLGSLSAQPSAISYDDGFFVFPTQVLARAVPSQGPGRTTEFAEGQALGAYTSFVELSDKTPDVKREIRITGGFLNNLTSKDEAKAFVYAFEGGAFPNVPLIQPRLNSIEEWRFVNHNNDEHPIHIHVNDFQVVEYYDPTTGLRTGPNKFGIDNANTPAPSMYSDETVIEPGILSVRTRFDEYIGLYVMHCHRLNHEDNGLMMLISVIPEISSYAVAEPGTPGKGTEVRVFDGNGDRLLATVTPFPGHQGGVSVAMGDVDDDGVYDLLVGAGKDHAPEVVVYSGKATTGSNAFTAELARFRPFTAGERGGVSVTAAQIDGSSADNIVVASGPGMASEVRVYSSKLPSSPGTAPALFATFSPYAGDRSGVSLTTGFVDYATGRYSIVTAPGPGTPAEVKVFAFPLLKPVSNGSGHAADHAGVHAAGPSEPANTASFKPFGDAYRGGVSLATGWLAGSLGGAERIVVSQLEDAGTVKVFSSGSALDDGPALYLQSPKAHGHPPTFREIASFNPFDGTSGTRVATTSTTAGANLLVSGVQGRSASVVRYELARPNAQATVLQARRLGEVFSAAGSQPVILGGD
ncbi:MAG: Multicopper oxidase type 3 [Microvirga sp.]|jgi:FtsP/CotA-like multicopper oxidase with cupredoxin domain|nr:Multicopper oxidase type 3 [Microvirga sp.]